MFSHSHWGQVVLGICVQCSVASLQRSASEVGWNAQPQSIMEEGGGWTFKELAIPEHVLSKKAKLAFLQEVGSVKIKTWNQGFCISLIRPTGIIFYLNSNVQKLARLVGLVVSIVKFHSWPCDCEQWSFSGNVSTQYRLCPMLFIKWAVGRRCVRRDVEHCVQPDPLSFTCKQN